MRKTRTVATWVLQILSGALFVLIGTAKFADPNWARKFERWGYPAGSHLVVGAVEIAAGLCLFVPALARYAAMTLIAVMLGAAGTHLMHQEMRRLSAPLLFAVLLGIIACLRWNRTAARGSIPAATRQPT
jgi:putative oxidoreductase